MDTFVSEPVIINILEPDHKFKVIKTIIFVGDIPSKILSALKSFLNDGPLNPILKKFYSADWIERIRKLSRKGITIRGGDGNPVSNETLTINGGDGDGDDFDFDAPVTQLDKKDDDAVENEVVDQKDEEMTKERLSDFIKEETIDITDLEKLTQAPVEEIEIETDIVLVTNIYAYPHDKIWDLKEKIYSVSGILPIYQHLWVEHQDIQHQCSYKIFNAGKRIPISAYNLLEKNSIPMDTGERKAETRKVESTVIQKIGNIPIDMQFYDDKYLIKVEALDTFEIIAEIYKRFGTTEFNLLSIKSIINESSRKQYASLLKNDRYQIDMIYFGFVMLYFPIFTYDVFINWVKDGELSLRNQFPDLIPSRKDITEKFQLETSITQLSDVLNLPENKSYLKEIESNIKLSIVTSTIKVLKMGSSKETIIYLRNLFDEYALSPTVDYVKTVMLINNKKTIFRKVYNRNSLISHEDSFSILHPIYDRISIGSILFRVRLNPNTTECLYFVIYQNGNYEIKASWREDLGFGFNEIFSTTVAYITPIIHTINKMESKVLYYGKQLPMIDRKNSKFSEIGMSIFWTYNLSDVQFKILRSIFDELRKAGIIELRASDRTEMEYYFVKGMYQYDATRLDKTITANNYYEYLSNGIIKQKWATVFTNTRVTRLIHRSADIKLEIMGIRENEYDIFNHYVYIALYMFLVENKKQKITTHAHGHRKKALIDNKEQDPELYNTRKIYKSEFIYSRICQKPYQPRMLNDAEYEELSSEDKLRAVKYWNFTRKIPVWYISTNPKYPYIRFIVGKHPRGFCIPCSKITKIPDNPDDPNKIIHDTCLGSHEWNEKRQTITVGSRYVMSYGKDIELDRLSRLPEKTLEPLFYDTYISSGDGMDQECANDTTNGYFLYGIAQHLPAIPNIGIFFCLARSLNMSPEEFINEIKKRLKSDPMKFKIIMNGEILNLFASAKELCNAFDEMMNTKNDTLRHLGEKWNVLLESIANIYFAINIIKFEDSENVSDSTGQRCRLTIPNRLSNIDDFIPESHQNLIVLYKKRDKVYYPIFQINAEIYFKTRIIDVKLFEYQHDLVMIIQKMAKSLYSEMRTYEHLDLNIIKKFLSQTKNWHIKKLFININNYCYGLLIGVGRAQVGKGKSSEPTVYIPIPRSFYVERTNIEYEPFYRKSYVCDFETLEKFIKDFNYWIADLSLKMGMLKSDIPKSFPLEQRVIPIFPFISIKRWLLLNDAADPSKSPEVIGFVFDNQNYYINPGLSPEAAFKKAKTKMYLMRYDPDDINKAIYEQAPPSKDPRIQNINTSIYKYYQYQLLLMEFMSLFSKQRNNKIRDQINSLIMKTNFATQLPDFYIGLRDIIEDNTDLKKVIAFIDNIVNGEWNKKELIANIKETTFNFDNVELDKLRKLNRTDLRKAITKIANNITVKTDNITKYLGPGSDFQFPNIFVVCKDNQNGYCQGKKLIIEKSQFDHLIDILVQDLQNPLKAKWIFSNVFNDRVISMFRFIQRPFERIDISFE